MTAAPPADAREARGIAPDVAPLLGLTGPGAWAIAALFAVTFATLAGLSGGEPMRSPLGWVALGLVLAAALALVVPGTYPLPLPLALGVVAVVAFGTAVIVWRLPTTGWPGWGGWIFGASTFLLFMVALRGRVGWGAIGMGVIVGITIHWTMTTTGDWRRGFDLTYAQVFSYCAVAFFALLLRRTARRVAEYRDIEARRLASEAAQESATDERRRHLARVHRDAGPALTEIAAGGTTATSRVDHGLLEAELRDQIRGRSLARAPLPEALRQTRARGVEITVLDDLRDEASPQSELAPAIAWAAARVTALHDGEATLRLARVHGRVTVTFATAHDVETFEVETVDVETADVTTT